MAKSAGTQDRELRKRRMAVAAALLAFAGIVGVLALLFGRDALAFLTDGHRVQQQVERLGPLAPVVFGLLVVLQEVTVIVPSEPLELAAGYAFGFWEGAFVYLAASVVGCFAIIAVVRFGGDRVLELVLTRKGREWLARLRGAQRFDFAILAAFFIPGLPKDLMAYLAAFAGMRPVILQSSPRPVGCRRCWPSRWDRRSPPQAIGGRPPIVFSVTAAAVVIGALAYIASSASATGVREERRSRRTMRLAGRCDGLQNSREDSPFRP